MHSWEVTNFAFSVIALVLSIFEMTSLRSGMLTPFFMLCSHLIKLTLFLGILGLDVAAVASRIDGLTPAIGLAFGCLQMYDHDPIVSPDPARPLCH